MKRFALCIIVMFLVFMGQDVLAQCSMCQAVVETSQHSHERSFGFGLNNAILYLMTVPYIALGVVGYLMYKKVKAHQN